MKCKDLQVCLDQVTKDIKEKGGFLGLATETTKVVEEYYMDGQINQGAPVSNQRSWIAPLDEFVKDNPELSQKDLACIKAVGSAEGTGRLVGTSIGAAAAPTVSTIPFVGWVVAGWVAMFGGIGIRPGPIIEIFIPYPQCFQRKS